MTENNMKVIGAGFGRTGTKSLWTALQQLGYRTHHMSEVFEHPESLKLWERVLEEGLTRELATKIYDDYGFDACVDYPSCFYYKELLALNPDAKVILTVRAPEKWLASVRSTIHVMYPLQTSFVGRLLTPINRWLLPFTTRGFLWANELVWRRHWLTGEKISSLDDPDVDVLPVVNRKWEAWISEIKQAVPEHQLLVYQVKDGWGPLCDFLKVPIPNEQFPNVNSKEDFASMIRFLKVLWYGAPVVAAAAIVVGSTMVYRYCI